MKTIEPIKKDELCCPFMGMIPLMESPQNIAGIKLQPQVQLKYMPCNPSICRFYNTDKKQCKFDLLFNSGTVNEKTSKS